MKRLFGFLSVLLVPVLGVAQTFGGWITGTADSGELYAATVNDSSAVLGQYCSSDSCAWIIGMSTSCEAGAKYTILANTDIGAYHLDIYCNRKLEGGVYQYVFTDFAAIDGLVKSGSRIGFAIPLEKDQFIVVRFLLNGSKAAIAALATEKNTLPNKGGTRYENM